MRLTIVFVATALLVQIPLQETNTVPSVDPLQQRVGLLELKDETFGDALGRLNQSFYNAPSR